MSFVPIPIHTLMKNDFLLKIKKILILVFSYVHVGQTYFTKNCPDGIEWQHFSLTQLKFEIETYIDIGVSHDYHVAIPGGGGT